METDLIVITIVVVATLIQAMIGFGSSLIAMPLLTPILGIQMASPGFALITLISAILNAIHWRAQITIREVGALIVSSLLTIPLGVLMVGHVDPHFMSVVLGVVLTVYAGYGLVGRPLPQPRHPAWAYATGLVSGVLAGAFNTGGPPVIAYADASRWPSGRFQANLQTFFAVSGILVVSSHAVAGNYTGTVIRFVLLSLPAMLLARIVGLRIGKRIPQHLFRVIVLVALLLLGLQLALS